MEGDKTYGENPDVVANGTPVRLEYEGTVEIEGGEWDGSTAHSVSVFMDEGTPELEEVEEDDDL